MNYITYITTLVFLAVQVVAFPSNVATECPSLFGYDPERTPGQRTGQLLLLSNESLTGVWVRLIFDKEFKNLTVDDGYEVVRDGKSEVLIKNRKTLLKAGQGTKLKITVQYEGSQVPNLIEYRLNARTMCPEASNSRKDFFQGDIKSPDFLLNTVFNAKHPIKQQQKCGLKPAEGQAYPWRASISIANDNQLQYICEATLVSPSHLVTTAHCVTFIADTTPIPRKLFALTMDGTPVPDVVKVIVHPGYEPTTLDNDIAILELVEPLAINDYVRPICLHTGEVNTGSIVGYSINDERVGGPLLEAKLQRISDEQCFKKSPKVENILGDNSYCLSHAKGNTNCVGISGSGFISSKDNVATLKAIVSLGIKLQNKNDCREDDVVVATDITRYIKWISRHSGL